MSYEATRLARAIKNCGHHVLEVGHNPTMDAIVATVAYGTHVLVIKVTAANLRTVTRKFYKNMIFHKLALQKNGLP